MARGNTETTIHVTIDRDGKTGELMYPISVRRPGYAAVERYEDVIIHGPCTVKHTPDRKRVLIYTTSRVEGRNKKP